MSEEQKNIIPELIEEKDPSSFKLIMALGIAGLLSGIILVGTYVYTAPIIKANKEAAMQRAIFKVLPECASYTTLKLADGKLIEKVADTGSKKETDKEELLIYAGYDANKALIGFAIPGIEPGFRVIMGVLLGLEGTRKVFIALRLGRGPGREGG